MVRVIHSYPVWLPLTQTWMYHQVKYLPADLVESRVVCEQTENLDQFPVPFVHSLEKAPSWRCFLDRGLRKIGIRKHLGFLGSVAKSTGAHLIHSHFGHVAWANLGALSGTELKHVATFYGLDVNFLPRQDSRWRYRYGELFQAADLILCEGPHMRECIIALGCEPHKTLIHRLGVPIGSFPYKPRSWNPGSPLRILIAGSFKEKKGIPYALDALGMLQGKIEMEITLVGDSSPEPRSEKEKSRIFSVIDRRNLAQKVRQLGYIPYASLLEEAYRHHIFLSPSVTAEDGDTEGGAPVTIIEMAATGMPVVSTFHCDIPQVISDAGSRLLTAERDSAALADRIQWLISNPSSWRSILDANRRHVESHFDAQTQGRRLSSIYTALF